VRIAICSAPVLVALALMREGLDALAAVELIRSKRWVFVALRSCCLNFTQCGVFSNGAINSRQLRWLEHEYKPVREAGCKCVIM
jgi:hypothetical protein